VCPRLDDLTDDELGALITMTEVWEFLARGGPLMIPIGLCSVLALTIFLERIWAVQRNRVLPPHFLSVLEPYIRERKWGDARRLADGSDSSIAHVLRGGLRRVGESRASVREGLEEAGRRAAERLSRYVGGLGAIASVSPLLGLLGTVTGMIEVFQRVDDTIRATGDVQPGELASGIWEALMTTAAGLAVAIPTYIAAKYLEGRIDRYVAEMEERADVFADYMASDGIGGLESGTISTVSGEIKKSEEHAVAQ